MEPEQQVQESEEAKVGITVEEEDQGICWNSRAEQAVHEEHIDHHDEKFQVEDGDRLAEKRQLGSSAVVTVQGRSQAEQLWRSKQQYTATVANSRGAGLEGFDINEGDGDQAVAQARRASRCGRERWRINCELQRREVNGEEKITIRAPGGAKGSRRRSRT